MKLPDNDTWAIVPAKPLKNGKNRLRNVLDDESRERVVMRFFRHVLGVLYRSPRISRIVVITLDPALSDVAKQSYEADIISKDPLDLNKAVSAGYQAVKDMGAKSVLVIPLDLPMLKMSDVKTVLDTEGDIVICPDRHMIGTNAVLLREIDRFQFRFGAESFKDHLGMAKKKGIVPQVAIAPGIEFDIDTPRDWLDYQALTSSVGG